ncbi:MAG: hypothetical protein M4579_004766 [Chaenotheca gracillima]|nr:MAG: hypothetical protein M4579_004766 [Chaenotheca gracillima]
MDPTLEADVDHDDAAYETQHVHQVYEQIASHFSSTRYKPWPLVETFLRELPPGSVGVDIGAGNGKYLAVNKDIFIVASDRSESLVSIAAQYQPHSAIVADSLSLPHSGGQFDFAISIAVIHHFSTPTRRVAAIKEILALLRGSSHSHRRQPVVGQDEGFAYEARALIYVWALEQKTSRRGWGAGGAQDVMVPWVTKERDANGSTAIQTFQRYYHLYRSAELEDDIIKAGGLVLASGYEKDNWWAIATRPAGLNQ